MKRVKIFILILSLFLIISACNSKSGGDAKDDQVEIVYMTHTPDTEEQKRVIEEDIIGAFEKKNPDIKVKWVQSQDPVTLIRQQMAAGAGPDVVLVDGPTTLVQFAKSDYLKPLDDYADKYGWNDRYFDWAYETGFVNDKLYGLPGQYESLAVWYNKDMFKKMDGKSLRRLMNSWI